MMEMRRIIQTFLTGLVLAGTLNVSAVETQRIAVVNLTKVFREFYKSRIAEEAIKQQAEFYRTYLIRQNEQIRKLMQQQREAENNSQNFALSEADRKKYQLEMEQKSREIRERRAHIELYSKEKNGVMREVEKKKRAEIMSEILAEIDRRAIAEGYGFVFDYSGRTLNEQPALLRYPESCDITSSVITELNRTKPAVTSAAPVSVPKQGDKK